MLVRLTKPTRRSVARAAFTLMELLVVVAILLVLVGVATPLYLNYLERSRKDVAKANAKSLAEDLKAFAISHGGEYPQEGDWSLLPLPPERKPPLDPWNMPYRWALRPVVSDEVSGTVIYEPVVWSAGPDRTDNTADDIASVDNPNVPQ